jgi:hypothetical protein
MKSLNHLAATGTLAAVLTMTACNQTNENPDSTAADAGPHNFGADVAFLTEHTDAVVLRDGDAAVVVVPEYQGRVMTATARGDDGPSSGWINYDVVETGVLSANEAKGKLEDHMYAFGGEERFWMGPEGGQYSIFFAPDKPFEFDHWFTPDAIDNVPWKVAEKSPRQVVFKHDFDLENHSGTKFKVGVKRTVSLLDGPSMAALLGGIPPEGIDAVAYQTDNVVTNRGDEAWDKESGLLSIWLLCMFQPSDTTTVFVPYKEGPDSELGPVVNADYFGKVPPARLKADGGVIYFKADGKERGKIGVVPERSLGIAGSYNPAGQQLTLLIYTPPGKHDGYVNSMWEMQKKPFEGDAINSYNDGPVDASGEQMGPFYELESSSPALALVPGASASHVQTIIHLYGDEADLQTVLKQLCEVDLKTVREAL